TYTAAATLGTANGTTVSLTDTGGTVAFGSTLDATTAGQQGLSISNNATFANTVGTTALRSLSVGGTAGINTTSITTTKQAAGTGNQTYTGQVTLVANTTLTGATPTFTTGVDGAGFDLTLSFSGT